MCTKWGTFRCDAMRCDARACGMAAGDLQVHMVRYAAQLSQLLQLSLAASLRLSCTAAGCCSSRRVLLLL